MVLCKECSGKMIPQYTKGYRTYKYYRCKDCGRTTEIGFAKKGVYK